MAKAAQSSSCKCAWTGEETVESLQSAVALAFFFRSFAFHNISEGCLTSKLESQAPNVNEP